jgi:hypothetical protein
MADPIGSKLERGASDVGLRTLMLRALTELAEES